MNLRPDRSMRILQIHPFLRGDRLFARAGGKSRVSLVLSRYLEKNGVEVAIFPWPEKIFGGRIAYGMDPGEELTVLPTMGFPGPWQIPGAWRRSSYGMESAVGFGDRVWRMLQWIGLQNALADFRPDIVHLHNSHSDFPVAFRAQAAHIPLVLTHHTGKYGPHVRDCDFLVCISKTFQQDFCRDTGYPRERTRVIYNCISPFACELPPLPAAGRQGWLFVGRPSAAKGLDLLLEAYRLDVRLREQPLHVCGAGEEEASFRQIAEKNQLPVTFHGRVSEGDLRERLRSARGVVIPSRSEGFSVALLDALANGTPVVGWAPQVKELEALWHIPVGRPFDARTQSAGELADEMRRFPSPPEDNDAWRSQLSQRTRQEFSTAAFGEAYRSLYREVLAA
jgi:glycosyltransferase involved in cell wall biosynthesis